MSKTKNFGFTLWDYTDAHKEALKDLKYKYIIYGHEEGEDGRPHLQGTIVFHAQRTMSAFLKKLKKHDLLRTMNIQQIQSNVCVAIDYCMKEDWNYFEDGERPLSAKGKGQKEKDRWKRARDAAAAGDFDSIDADIHVRCYNNLKKIHCDARKRRKLNDTETQHLWYWGKAGTGKSRKARTDHPDAYLKMCSKWWDGYDWQETVIIEDFDIRHEKLIHHMKLWADRYPFMAEIKGSAMKIRPDLIIVTSNYHPREIWHQISDLDPILRRFKTVEFKTLQ